MRPSRRDRIGTRATATVSAEQLVCAADNQRSTASGATDLIEVACELRNAVERETFAECLHKLVQLLPQITRSLRRRQLPAGPNDSPLGPRHGVALSVLRDRGPMTVGRLAGELGLTLATVSGIVADVERAGFVQRSADPEDRRRTIVALAEPHAAALGTWLDGATAPMARALDQLSPAERIVLLKVMTLLDSELNGADSDADFDRPVGSGGTRPTTL